jgi:hypothetical protein
MSLTIEDIRNPNVASGFKHVGSANAGRNGHGQRADMWRARVYGGKLDSAGTSWTGPSRRTPEQAAQDYCDYMNGAASPAPLPSYSEPDIDMGNTTRHAPKLEAVRVIRPQFDGPHDLYDVIVSTANGDTVCRKVGITARGHARYADICKTLGLSIKPFADAVTYPSKEAARAAEDARVAEVCKDDAWRRVGKEAFAPATEGGQQSS